MECFLSETAQNTVVHTSKCIILGKWHKKSSHQLCLVEAQNSSSQNAHSDPLMIGYPSACKGQLCPRRKTRILPLNDALSNRVYQQNLKDTCKTQVGKYQPSILVQRQSESPDSRKKDVEVNRAGHLSITRQVLCNLDKQVLVARFYKAWCVDLSPLLGLHVEANQQRLANCFKRNQKHHTNQRPLVFISRHTRQQTIHGYATPSFDLPEAHHLLPSANGTAYSLRGRHVVLVLLLDTLPD